MLTLSRISVLLALGVGLALAGCGDEDDESGATSPPPPAQSSTPAAGAKALTLSADEGGALKYDKSSLSADAGTVEIAMDNPSQIPHNVGIEGDGVDEKGPVVEKGGTSTVSLDLEAGTYEFYCSVGSHRDAGMKGTLTVR